MSREATDDIAVYEQHDFEVRCRCPVGLVPLKDEGHKGPGISVEVAPDGDGLRRTAVAEILSVAKYRWADSRHLDRVPRGLIAAGVTVARRSEEEGRLVARPSAPHWRRHPTGRTVHGNRGCRRR